MHTRRHIIPGKIGAVSARTSARLLSLLPARNEPESRGDRSLNTRYRPNAALHFAFLPELPLGIIIRRSYSSLSRAAPSLFVAVRKGEESVHMVKIFSSSPTASRRSRHLLPLRRTVRGGWARSFHSL